MSSGPQEAVISLTPCMLIVVTTQEYESLLREIEAKHLVGDVTLGDQILARLLHDNLPRYLEAKRENEQRREHERSGSQADHSAAVPNQGRDDG